MKKSIQLFSTRRFNNSSSASLPPNPNRVVNKIKFACFSLILTILFLLPIISSIEFDMKTEFDQGETLLAKVSGNFLEPILMGNVYFYRGHVRIPMEYDVTKINDEFYIYALLSKTQGNYSIEIKDVLHIEQGQASEKDIIRNFSISNDTADFSVTPGFIVTKEDFFVEVQNLQDEKINIKIKDEDISIPIISGAVEKLNFELGNIEEALFKTIELSTDNLKYEIPVYVFLDNLSKEQPKEKNFKFEPSEIEITLPTNSETERIIYLYNTGEETLENFSIFISESLIPYVLFSVEEFGEFEAHSNVKIKLYFSSDDVEKTIQGRIIAEEESLYVYSDITLNFIKDYIPLDVEEEIKEEIIATTETCEEMQGVICVEGKECDEKEFPAKDDICCPGSCIDPKKSSIGKIIGWIIVAVLFIFVIWFFKKRYRGAKREFDLLNLGKK